MIEATVIGVRGQRLLVETADSRRLECLSHKQQPRCCCGDRLLVEPLSQDQCVLHELLPRDRLFYRADPFKRKLLAANISQVVIVVAVEPVFSDELISRILTASTLQQVSPLIVLNKTDLVEGYRIARNRLQPFVDIGVPLVETAITEAPTALRDRLVGHLSLLIGQSGMGKSTLLNVIIPSACAITREISAALNAGRHTTTTSTLYHLDGQPTLIDSPGLTQFGLYGQEQKEIERAFVEFLPYLRHCRFADCQHDREPNCAIVDAVAAGRIDRRRWETYHRIVSENAFVRY